MTLGEARRSFTFYLVMHLLPAMYKAGYRPALNEGMDRLTAKDPSSDHMKGSLHDLGLAQDIDLYDNAGKYLSKTEDHQIFGELWESLHKYCKWGGRWGDGNHYSFAPPELVGNRK